MSHSQHKYRPCFLLMLSLLLALSACQPEPLPAPLPSQTKTAQETRETLPPEASKEEIHNSAYFMRLDVGHIENFEEENEAYQISLHQAEIGKTTIDALVSKRLEDLKTAFIAENKDFKAADKDFRAILKLSTATFAIDETRFTYLIQSFVMNGGEAHGMSQYETLYFDTKEDRQVPVTELLQEPYLSVFEKESDAFFRQSESYKAQVDLDSYRLGLEAKPDNYKNIIITAEGVDIIFPRYQVFSGNYGEPAVNIPFGKQSGLFLLSKTPSPSPSPVATISPSPAEITSSAPNGAKLIALTFDDGPYAPVDQRIMNALAAVKGHVSFFWLGNRLSSYPDDVKAVRQAGHEIGNHSNTHPQLTKLDLSGIQAELAAMDQALEQLIQVKPKLVRPTYGAYNESVQNAADRPLINWSVDTLDWQSRNADKVYKAIMEGAKDGAIILMHDLYPSTAEAVERAIPELSKQGYRFVTVSELLAQRMPDVKKGQVVNACPPQ